MAKFYGVVGYEDSVENPLGSGVYKSQVTEKAYYGDTIRNAKQNANADKVNDDITVSNSISIVADEFAVKHFTKIKYVWWAEAAWTVTSVEVRAPRLILNLGSVYNGPTTL